MKTKSLRSIRKAYWRKLMIYALVLLGATFAIVAFFWRAITEHAEFTTAVVIVFMVAIGFAALGFLHLRDVLINPLIDLGRAARAQKLLGIPLKEENYEGTMVHPLAQVLAHHEEGDLEIANTNKARDWAHAMGDRKLRDLSFVVFDTETTGLNPQADDQIIQIGAVRVKRGEVDARDYFASYANPAQRIPLSSTRIHGIDNKRVAKAKPTAEVVQDFRDWSSQDVLVAHNASFDMAFLRKTKVEFDHYVICTAFISAFLFDHTGTHTLDALAQRLDVKILPELRHDAHGDALVTAQVFAKLIPLLEERGVETLDDAIALGQRMRRIRRAQAIYG